MTPDRPEPTTPGTPDPDPDLGAPVTELQGLMLPVGDRFPKRVRNAIDRRLLAGTLLDLAWTAPLMVVLELLRAPFERFSRKRGSP